MLEVDDVHAHYGHIEALHGVSVRVDRGEIVTIIGANGAGKSTLLMTICGRPEASAGTIVFDGQRLNGLAPYDIVAPRHRPGAGGAAHLPVDERAREPADGRGADQRRAFRGGRGAGLHPVPTARRNARASAAARCPAASSRCCASAAP